MPSAILSPPIISPFLKMSSPHPTSTTSSILTAPPSPSGTPLNLSDPSQNNPDGSHGRRHQPTSSLGGSSCEDEGTDEGIYIAPSYSTKGDQDVDPCDEEEDLRGETTNEGRENLSSSGNSKTTRQPHKSQQRAQATEFSALNLAQSSPSPPSSLHFEVGSSPQSSQMDIDSGNVKSSVPSPCL